MGSFLVVLLGLGVSGCSRQAPSGQPAVDTLVGQYDAQSGIWPTTGWWNSANAITALIDYMIATGDRRYLWVVENTYAKKITAERGNFINDLTDDTGWWALAWIRAYDLTGQPRYLATARAGIDAMWRAHDDTCGGGLRWTATYAYKNAVANALYIKAAAELSMRLPSGGADYLARAKSVWEWFEASGMINSDGLINDGLDPRTCQNNRGETWTYNQGVILGALVDLSAATGDRSYLKRATDLADASTTSERLNPNGILTEPCEAYGCGVDGPSFKGIYVRNLGELNRVIPDRRFSDYLLRQATTAYDQDRTADDYYGLHWAGPIADVNAATQQSSVDLLVAVQPASDGPSSSVSVPVTTASR